MYTGTPPVTVEKHVTTTVMHTLAHLKHGNGSEPISSLDMARHVAQELVYEGLVPVDKYDETKLSILGLFNDTDELCYIQNSQIIRAVSPFVKD